MNAEKKKTALTENKIFVLLLLLIMLAGLAATLFFPDDINGYENRYAYKIAPPTLSSVADGSFQDGVENALSDQVQFAAAAKKVYNFTVAVAAAPATMALEDYFGADDYVYYNGSRFYNGKILFYTYSLAERSAALDAKAENINETAAKHPELEFFVYYIEKDTDIDMISGVKPGLSDYFLPQINIPEENKGCFRVDSFDVFDKYFYDTDHHWNYKGSYLGYTQVLSMISGDEAIKPDGVYPSGQCCSGSKTFGMGNFFKDEMSIYRFDYPAMTITVNGVPAEDYGAQSRLIAGEIDIPTYGEVYGGDFGEIIFDTGKEGENLLVIGESYDNAILKLLASHFSKTYSVDLRYYAANMGADFDFDAYVAEHSIDKVLLIGNIDYFVMSEFSLR